MPTPKSAQPESARKQQRQCSGCTLCCRLLPTVELNKKANERCPHQVTGKGCRIYDRRPMACRMWACRWLTGDDTADLRRPDRSHVVIDLMPDFVTVVDDETGAAQNIEVVQIWCDATHPDAWRDPALLAYLERRAAEGVAAIIRYDDTRAIVVFPPALSVDRQWHERSSEMRGKAHTLTQIVSALSSTRANPNRKEP